MASTTRRRTRRPNRSESTKRAASIIITSTCGTGPVSTSITWWAPPWWAQVFRPACRATSPTRTTPKPSARTRPHLRPSAHPDHLITRIPPSNWIRLRPAAVAVASRPSSTGTTYTTTLWRASAITTILSSTVWNSRSTRPTSSRLWACQCFRLICKRQRQLQLRPPQPPTSTTITGSIRPTFRRPDSSSRPEWVSRRRPTRRPSVSVAAANPRPLLHYCWTQPEREQPKSSTSSRCFTCISSNSSNNSNNKFRGNLPRHRQRWRHRQYRHRKNKTHRWICPWGVRPSSSKTTCLIIPAPDRSVTPIQTTTATRATRSTTTMTPTSTTIRITPEEELVATRNGSHRIHWIWRGSNVPAILFLSFKRLHLTKFYCPSSTPSFRNLKKKWFRKKKKRSFL